jgi:hypothetical protein
VFRSIFARFQSILAVFQSIRVTFWSILGTFESIRATSQSILAMLQSTRELFCWISGPAGQPDDGCEDVAAALLVFAAAAASNVASYYKARMEMEGVECEVGLFGRQERLLLIILGAWLGPGYSHYALWGWC